VARKQRMQTASASGGTNKLFYVILGVVVLGGVGWLVLAGRGDGPTESPAAALAGAAEIESDPNAGVPLGPEGSPAEIWEFFDFSCPHCANFAGFTGRLLRQHFVENGGPVRWVSYDYVLGSFPNSLEAALSARCARDQGEAGYWLMHDMLLARQLSWAMVDNPSGEIRDIAEEAGLDGRALRSCVQEQRHLETVLASRRFGDELGVNSTPALFLNGRRLDGDETSYEGFEQLIEAAIDSAAAAAGATGAVDDAGDGQGDDG